MMKIQHCDIFLFCYVDSKHLLLIYHTPTVIRINPNFLGAQAEMAVRGSTAPRTLGLIKQTWPWRREFTLIISGWTFCICIKRFVFKVAELAMLTIPFFSFSNSSQASLRCSSVKCSSTWFSNRESWSCIFQIRFLCLRMISAKSLSFGTNGSGRVSYFKN